MTAGFFSPRRGRAEAWASGWRVTSPWKAGTDASVEAGISAAVRCSKAAFNSAASGARR
jgi:hypothetical protein